MHLYLFHSVEITWFNFKILVILSGGLHNYYEESAVCHTKPKLMQSLKSECSKYFSDLTPKQTTPKI
jgi:hypothetical protein